MSVSESRVDAFGEVVLLGAPIGDATDVSGRFVTEIGRADVVAAEDTRRLRRLCQDLDVRLDARVVSYFDGNEDARTGSLLAEAEQGNVVALITDAGMPSISDPGYVLVTQAISRGIPVRCVPGPSAVTTALALSGLPAARFCFEGFLPRRPGPRRRHLAVLADEARTMVFFESPHRMAATLADMARAWGDDRPAVACREMTKTYEEIRRGTLGSLRDWAEGGLRGELTLVVAGRTEAAGSDLSGEDLAAMVAASEREGASRKEAIAAVAVRVGLPKREVYAAVVESPRR